MQHLRKAFGVCLVVLATFVFPNSALADGQREVSPLLKRALEYDRLPITPPGTPAQQQDLIAATLAAHETQTGDPGQVAEVLDELGVLVTYLVKSDTQFVWDGFDWVYDTRTEYTYSGDKPTEWVTQVYDPDVSEWVNSSRMVTVYDGNGRPSSVTLYGWTGTEWANSSTTTFTYDGSGNPTYVLYQTWNGFAWVNFANSTMTYSGSLLATAILQNWTGSAWANTQKNVYTYSGGRLTEDLWQAWVGSTWADAERITYTYDGSGRMTLSLSERWNVSGPWTNWTKVEYEYDGATTNETLAVHWSWSDGSWSKVWADTSKYSGNLRTELLSYYFQAGSLLRTQYFYDGMGNLIEDIESTGFGGFWLLNTRGVYVYIVSSILGDAPVSAGLPSGFEIGQNFPNPFNAGTVIPFRLPGRSHWRLTVCNLMGQTVRTFEGDSDGGPVNVTWDGEDDHGDAVPSGVYLSRVESKSRTQSRKMVLLR